MEWFVQAVLIAVGLLHLIPAVGVLGPQQLQRLYGVELTSPDLTLLMRHRAVLFGLLGAALIGAAVARAGEVPALVAGVLSVGSFLVLAPEHTTPAVRRVVVADRVALVALGCAIAARLAA